MLNIRIKTVPEHMIRAQQSGDWRYSKQRIVASVAENLYPPDNELMIGIHEVIEAWLCRKLGIKDRTVVKFDEMYEKERANGHHKPEDEAGDDPRSPYRYPHMAAIHVERAVGSALDVSWIEHERLVMGSAAVDPKNVTPLFPQFESAPDLPSASSTADQPDTRQSADSTPLLS